MPAMIIVVAIVLALLGILLFGAGINALRSRTLRNHTLRKRRYNLAMIELTLAFCLLCFAALLCTVAVATRGYRALTREEVAAVVRVEPSGSQSFSARFQFPDGREARFNLAGDQLYVDAHILKWKPLANFLGLHTAFELDRVTGRYMKLEDETNRPRTVFSLATHKLLDLFTLRQRYLFLSPLLDAEYGSATFMMAQTPAIYEVRVSTTGLLIRPIEVAPAATRK